MIDPLSRSETNAADFELRRPPAAAVVSGPWASQPGDSTREARYQFGKRTLDLVLAGLLLVLLAPLMLLVMFLIRLTSRGPAIFRQPRAGRDCVPFEMFKFRSMRLHAQTAEAALARHSSQGCFFKLKQDPRITRLGGVLRRFSIDETPQIWNVLRGEMSLVGPRPLLLTEMQKFPLYSQRHRFRVKPGLTGLWQVSGRSLCSDRERMRLDLEYVENASLWLDLEILIKTIPAVLSGKGAY